MLLLLHVVERQGVRGYSSLFLNTAIPLPLPDQTELQLNGCMIVAGITLLWALASFPDT